MATITYTATAPDGSAHTRSTASMPYTHALAVADKGKDNWGIWSWHQSADAAHKASNSGYHQSHHQVRVVDAIPTAIKGKLDPEDYREHPHYDAIAELHAAKQSGPRAKVTPLTEVGLTGSAILDAAVAAAAQDKADEEATPANVNLRDTKREERNRKARERRAAKKAAQAPAKPVQDDEDAAIAEVGGEDPTLDPAAVAPADHWDDQADAPEVIRLPNANGEVVELEVEPAKAQDGQDADDQISQTLEVTEVDIEAAKASMVKGDKCPGYGMVVEAKGQKGNASHARVECPVCGHSVKRYDKSGKLGSHRV